MTRSLTTIRSLAALTLAASAALGFAKSAAADPVELRIATIAPSGSDWGKVLEKGGAEVATKTAGRASMKFFMDGQQGGEADYISKIRAGQLDGAGVTAVGLALIDESIRVLELPMMYNNIDEMDYVADKMWPYFQKKFEKKGFHLNDRGDVGWIHILSKKKIATVADLRAAKIWKYGGDNVFSPYFAALGLNGVPLDIGEVDAALTGGRIDACYGSPLAATALQWASKVKYMTGAPISYAISATVISNTALAKFTPEDLKTMNSVAKSMGKKLRKVIRQRNEESKKSMTRMGVEIVESPAAMTDELRTTAEKVWKQLAGKIYSQAELDMVLKYREEYRTAHPAK